MRLHLDNHKAHSHLHCDERHPTQPPGLPTDPHSDFRSAPPLSRAASHRQSPILFSVLLGGSSPVILPLSPSPQHSIHLPGRAHSPRPARSARLGASWRGALGEASALGMCLECHGPHSSARANARHSPGPHGRKLLGSGFSATLGNLSWAMTCTHLVSVLPNTI